MLRLRYSLLYAVPLAFMLHTAWATTCSVFCPDGHSVPIGDCDAELTYDPCGRGGGGGGGGGYTPPPGPTPQQIKERREAKDSLEASQDADDKGVSAYQRG